LRRSAAARGITQNDDRRNGGRNGELEMSHGWLQRFPRLESLIRG
jgi:hypothetical protein